MRLTTRLMQIASWLLLQRAANSGEMTRNQVAAEKCKVRLDTASAPDNAIGWEEFPEAFLSLINRSLSLQNLVRRMDEEIYGNEAAGAPSHRRNNPSPTRSTCSIRPSPALSGFRFRFVHIFLTGRPRRDRFRGCKTIRIIGIDPGLRRTGWGIIDTRGNS